MKNYVHRYEIHEPFLFLCKRKQNILWNQVVSITHMSNGQCYELTIYAGYELPKANSESKKERL